MPPDDCPITSPDPFEHFAIVLRALPDPVAARGYPARTPSYRAKLLLKRLLRDFGFRAVKFVDPATLNPLEIPSEPAN